MPSPHSHLSSRVKQSSLQSLGIQARPTRCPGRSYFSRLFKWSPGGSSRPLPAPPSFRVVGTVGKAGSTAPSGATFWTHLRLPRGIILLALSYSPRTRSQIEKCYVISNSFFSLITITSAAVSFCLEHTGRHPTIRCLGGH